MNKLNLQPIVLCGGCGSRLWPLSKESFPKQFLNLIGKNETTLLQETLLRLKKLKNIEDPIFICNEQHRFIVAEQIREINIKPKEIILEPFGRNTAPAIAIGALRSRYDMDDSVLLVLSSDHIIKDVEKYIEIIQSGYNYALQDRLVTFGVIPTSPETGYGYIESDEIISEEKKAYSIIRFVEKPNSELAKKLFLDRHFSWNSGMFMFKVSSIIKEFSEFAPKIINLCSTSLKNAKKDLDFLRLDKEFFYQCASISIDNAILEKTKIGSVLSLDVGWSDIGSWQSLWENEDKDKDGNFIKGNVFSEDIKNCYVRGESRFVACFGIDDLIIIENSDSILITKRSLSQNVKPLVETLISKNVVEAKSHKKVYRPWGNYTSIAEDDKWQVKKILVKPGASLSLQMHHHRSEHWVIVSGTALVEIDHKNEFFSENESVYIPLGSKHRLTNPGKLNLVLIEVQSGSYLGEDDICRFKDDYGRG